MGQKIATLEIGLEMLTADAAANLTRFRGVVDKTMQGAIDASNKAEAAIQQMGNTAAPVAGMADLAKVTRDAAAARREYNQIERAGESMVGRLDRETAAYGKTASEMRALKAETAALNAERKGQAELAERIRASEAALFALEFKDIKAASDAAKAAAEDKAAAADKAVAAATKEATAAREATHAYQMFQAAARDGMATHRESEAANLRAEAAAAEKLADEHGRLASMVRGSHDAQEADAAAAERLRASTDPLYASTKRLNAEIAESTRLYHAGATAEGEYARQQQVLGGRLRELGAASDQAAGGIGKSNFALKQTAVQIPDIVSGLLTGQKPMMVFLQQGGQIAQIAQMAEGGIKGYAASLGGLLVRFLPLIVPITVATAGLALFKHEVSDDAALKNYANSLGLTHREMKKLGDVSVTTGDFLAGLAKTIGDRIGLSSLFDGFGEKASSAAHMAFTVMVDAAAGYYAAWAGSYNAIIATWRQFPAAFADLVIQGVNKAAEGIEWLVNKTIDGVNRLGLGLEHVDIGKIENRFAGAGAAVAGTFADEFKNSFSNAKSGIESFVGDVAANTAAHAQERVKKKAEEIIADRTPKTDRHAEQLAREAEAIEAQIRNLYKLADAYGVSGAAALIAEARVKAESQAIKQRGDIEAFVDRQVRLSIAQRVSDAAKSTATMRDQAAIQEEVNAKVAAGLVPAARAAELVKDQIADLPLLAAIQAARQRGLTEEAGRATKALEDQRAARERLSAAEIQRQHVADIATGADQLAVLREELRLVGATDAARVHALATIKATQEAEAKHKDLDQTAEYVRQQVGIADAQQAVTEAQDAFNESLSFSADMFDAIDQSAQRAAQGISDAFGSAGAAIGGALTSVTSYYSEQARMQQAHDAQIKAAGTNQQRIDHENALYAARTADAQIGLYGNLAGAAKGFFKEHGAGYKAMEAIEKAFRAVQLAMSIQSMVQNVLETTGVVAGAAIKATAEGTVGVAKQSQLPFPANMVAMAATAAALVAAGVAVLGGGGGGHNNLPKANDGIGTVLGDTDAKSASIKNALDALKDIDDVTLGVSRDMLTSLRSIENNIGGLASLLVRTGNIDASSGVAEGFKTDAIGSILSKIPVIGGILGSLFGTKTKVVGSGLYGGAQSVGDILDSGFDASYYSDVQKKKKLFGLTTSTKYSTKLTGADGEIEDQFTLLLRQFYETIGKAATPLGQSLDQVQAKLLGFTVDIGKIDLQGLSGTEIQEKLEAVFGAAADNMAKAGVPGLEKFQKVGEGYFETLVRVASTVEQVDATFQKLGRTTGSMGIDIDMAVAGLFDSVSDFTSAAGAYFETYYSDAEQAAAKSAQLGKAFVSLGLAMPNSLAGFRSLVDAQDLATAAGQQTYATLLQLAPAFADLQKAMNGAKSAADILSEREGLQQKLLELTGDTAAIRAAELAKLDVSNRALQEQIYAITDAQAAAKAAEDLRDAWKSVGDTILDEVNRIRGLSDASGGGTFASLMGQFNAANTAARAGDQDAAKNLPQLSKSLLDAAALAATSRQELDRVQAQTAAALEATYAAIGGFTGDTTTTSSATDLTALAGAQTGTATTSTTDSVADLRKEMETMRTELMAALATIAGNTGRSAKTLENVTASGGDAISVANG